MQVIIIGAGSVGSSIAKELIAHGHSITIIDEKPEVIGRSGSLKNVHWIIGDACEFSTLKQSSPDECDVIVATTGDDKTNLVVSLMARSEFGVPRTVARVNNPKNEWLFDDSWGVDVAVSTPRLMTALVEEAVEVGDVVRLLSLQAGGAMLVEYTVPADHPIIGHTVAGIQWPAQTTLTAILRDGTPLAPTADDIIEGDDELFFITTTEGEEDIRLLFS
ncbi:MULTISPECIES: TrkA family potassium uptake protein [unclassified Rothia (in: high G+C Gram-positive bacteria)]|uniref:potassium channel family protein n=1 Tax=unclassified Rothia (in: high G+C Gram-positive bacteria) TaxID=2689056 RepID=UPI00195D3C6A|nr:MULTISPECIES: NAD-binding protein [unclassified Rothia (in: high G+C Gram-positive bacteria)]MBM7050695.1 NAD-binding protein [Rothia sp. ZJ1223]QRZ60881.1 NAD-binding protein [Rothia sp. ZJ932]